MPTIKILIVTDGGGGYTRSNQTPPVGDDFHLGEFVKVLEDTNWSGFDIEITKAHRGGSSSSDLQDFDFSDHNLMQYDEILLFPILRDTNSSSLISSTEIQAISDFMDAGGGVFATGDHEDLGAAVCREIPRVRSMRRWYFTPGNPPTGGPDGQPAAPSGTSEDRRDTTRSGYDSTYQFSDQSDNTAQEIEPTMFSTGHGRGVFYQSYPHPLLCSPDGIVRYLPDHGHEGECEVPSDLTKTVLGKDEYPKLPNSTQRLAPVVVAQARVIDGHNLTYNNGAQIKPPVKGDKFGVIGAYDGHRIVRDNKRLGRIVVDATWHHFFNINLKGAPANGAADGSAGDATKELGFYAPLRSNQDDHYEMIKHYFRNIVYWLIPAKRTKFVYTGIIEQLVNTGYFYEEIRFDFQRPRDIPLQIYIQIAHLAEAYFKSVRGECSKLYLSAGIWREIDPIRDILDKIGPVINPWELQAVTDLKPETESGLLPFSSQFNASVNSEISRVMLGATVASFVLAKNELSSKDSLSKDVTDERAELFEKILPEAAKHAFAEFGKALKLEQEKQHQHLDEIHNLITPSSDPK